MNKFFIFWAVVSLLVSQAGKLPLAGSGDCANLAAFRLDGVDLSVCLPFAVQEFIQPEPGNKIQTASAVDAGSQRQFSVTAMPLGVRPAAEALPVLAAGRETAYRVILQDFRAGQGGVLVESPVITLFGRAITGAANVVTLNPDGLHPQAVKISEWLAEASGRIWLVRLAEPIPVGTSPQATQSVPVGMALASPDPAAPSTSMASLKAGPPALPAFQVPQAALANLPVPAWWSGDCDTNNYTAKNGRPSYPLGASYLGMKACGPRFFDFAKDTLVIFFNGAWGEYEWECVELSMRFLYLAFGVPPYPANGNQVVSAYNGTRLVKISNQTPGKPPRAGDVLSLGPYSSVGHTAVVTSANVDAYGNGTMTLIEENDSASGARTDSVVGWNVQDSLGVIGWLHDPTYDSQIPPIVTFSPANPAPGRWYNSSQTIAWSSTDYVGMWGYSQAWDVDPGGSAPQVVGPASGTANFNGLTPGQHTLYVRVWDNSSSHHTAVFTTGWYGYEMTPPTGGISGIVQGQVITTRSLPLRLALSDAGGSGVGLARVTAAWAGHPAGEVLSNLSGSGIYSWDLCVSGVPNGVPVTINLDVWDAAGNAALAAGGSRYIIKNYACTTPLQVTLGQPSSLTPLYTTAANECTHYWKQMTDLNGQPLYLTLNADTLAHSTNSARWTPDLLAAGQYRVEALIPHHALTALCHTAAPSADTGAAAYSIQYQGGMATVTVNQQSYSDQWADLGTYSFAAGTGAAVTLSDVTGETTLSHYVVFGELRFTPLTAPAACYGLNLALVSPGAAGVNITPPNCANGQYTPGTQVVVAISPQTDLPFNHWDGSLQTPANPLTLTMDGDKALVAYFDHFSFLPAVRK